MRTQDPSESKPQIFSRVNKYTAEPDTSDSELDGILVNYGIIGNAGDWSFKDVESLTANIKKWAAQEANKARVDELESNRNQIGYSVGSITMTKDDVDDRIEALTAEKGDK